MHRHQDMLKFYYQQQLRTNLKLQLCLRQFCLCVCMCFGFIYTPSSLTFCVVFSLFFLQFLTRAKFICPIFQKLFQGVKQELYFFCYPKFVSIELSDNVSFLNEQLTKLQGKQITLRGRSLTGKSKLSNTQVCPFLHLHKINPYILIQLYLPSFS